MKRLIFLLFLGVITAPINADVIINEQNFPDAGFREFLIGMYGTELSDEEINSTTELTVKNSNTPIYNITGIGFLVNLQQLSCNSPNLSSADISVLTNLSSLKIEGSRLTSLDVRKNTNLKSLILEFNGALVYIDITGCVNLEEFSCIGSAPSSIDFSNNKKIKKLSLCGIPYGETAIAADLSFMQELEYLDISCTDINIIKLPADATQLQFLRLYWCNLKTLDTSNYPHLQRLECNYNDISSLNVSQNKELVMLDCSQNQLTQLDLSNNIDLQSFNCDSNQLTELDISSAKELADLFCRDNNLKYLDVSNNTELQIIACCINNLTELDLSKCPQLWSIECQDNYISRILLNSSRNDHGYTIIECYNNEINIDALNTMVESLPDYGWAAVYYYNCYYHSDKRTQDENQCNMEIINKAAAKGWIFVDAGTYQHIDENYLTDIYPVTEDCKKTNMPIYDLYGNRLQKEPLTGIFIKNKRKFIIP